MNDTFTLLQQQIDEIKVHADAMAAEHARMRADLQAAIDYGAKLRAGLEEYWRLSEGWNRTPAEVADEIGLVDASETFSTKIVPELLALPNPADRLNQAADNIVPLGPFTKANNRVEVLEAVLEDILGRAYVAPLDSPGKCRLRAGQQDLEKWRAVLNHNC